MQVPPPIPRPAVPRKARTLSNRDLQVTIATAQVEVAKQSGKFIDLTLSSDDDMEDVPEEAIASARLLADLLPEMMAGSTFTPPAEG